MHTNRINAQRENIGLSVGSSCIKPGFELEFKFQHIRGLRVFIFWWMEGNISALQAATILVTMASGKNSWQLKFWRKSPIGDLQI